MVQDNLLCFLMFFYKNEFIGIILMLAFLKKFVIMRGVWQRSSVVEQRNHNPLVGGPNPSAATRINKRPDGSFFYSVRRGGDGHPDGGPTRRQKADGRMPVPRSFNEGGCPGE